MKKYWFLLVFFLIFLANISFATDLTDCTDISSSGYYRVINDINAQFPSASNACFFLREPNTILDFDGHTIIGMNNSAYGVYYGVLSADSNLTIMNGILKNFTLEEIGSGLVISCAGSGCSNEKINNIQLLDNRIGLVLYNVSNSNFHLAIDQSVYETGCTISFVNNSTFNLFARAKTYGCVLFNVTNSKLSGHYDTDIIIQENVTTLGGNFLSTITLGLLPPTIFGTYTTTTQSKGIGLMVWNSSNNIFQDISSLGLIQGISLESSTKNTLARIELALSGKYTGGKFGGLWLGVESVNNTLCEIKGLINDDCNQLLLSTTCSQKNNVYYDSCSNIFNLASLGTAITVSEFFMTPLIPNLKIPAYPFVTYMFTPFFLALFTICGCSVWISMKTNVKYGIYFLIFMVILLSMISLTTFWFGLVFVTIIGYFLIKTYQKEITYEKT